MWQVRRRKALQNLKGLARGEGKACEMGEGKKGSLGILGTDIYFFPSCIKLIFFQLFLSPLISATSKGLPMKSCLYQFGKIIITVPGGLV